MQKLCNNIIYKINENIYKFGYGTLYNLILFITNLFIFINYYIV